ncbi:DUF6876 family protein [Burkholderia vietnamiensis]|uniref:DUF6876 family protein n=1 Tax=Burkholderia vietnamiensis TaxID=60552 RepID=UPI001CF1DA6F|nr:DUF6876 family protein [Burkholderia vietnamiensis]MCA8287625.1 hypothetical protein [Burkholderia vietnamiensis]
MDHGIEQTTNGNSDPAAVPPPPVTHHQADSNTTDTTTKESKTMSKATIDAVTLGQFTGTENYYRLGPVLRDALATDGVHYLMTNGLAWLVTDAVAVCVLRAEHDGFFMIEFTPREDGSGELVIGDGNGTVIHRQEYRSHSYNLTKPLRLFAEWGEVEKPQWVILLASEH